jgi:membrane-associated phospholipid phosphatase
VDRLGGTWWPTWPRLALMLVLMAYGAPSAARDAVESSGDIGRIVLPAVALATTFWQDDRAARPYFYRSFAVTMLGTYGLKATVDKQRPDGSDDDAFPSGHAAVAFHSAAFLHRRYGRPVWWAYALAAYVGWTRIDADEHDTADALAGAALGAAAGWWGVEPRAGLVLAPRLDRDVVGLSFYGAF